MATRNVTGLMEDYDRAGAFLQLQSHMILLIYTKPIFLFDLSTLNYKQECILAVEAFACTSLVFLILKYKLILRPRLMTHVIVC